MLSLSVVWVSMFWSASFNIEVLYIQIYILPISIQSWLSLNLESNVIFNMFHPQEWHSIQSEEGDKNSLNRFLEQRARTLEEQCAKVKEYRRVLEDRKMFWRNREEQFRVECYKVKKQAANECSKRSQNMNPNQQRVYQKTAKVLIKAEQFLREASTK